MSGLKNHQCQRTNLRLGSKENPGWILALWLKVQQCPEIQNPLKRELNPNIRREHNLPVERSSSREEREKSDQQRAPTPAGNSWIERAYHRIKEQAEREGKSVEEVAKERWGSLDKFKSLLGKIEEDKKAKVDENKK